MSLPENWDEMSVGALWDKLNDPRRFPTPLKSTVEAILFAVRERGLKALQEPANKERLARCDQAAKAEIEKRIEALRQKGMLL